MLFTGSLATTEVTPCDLSDGPCSLLSLTIKPAAYENTEARQNLELIVTCPLVGVFSCLLPSVSFDLMTPPNWITVILEQNIESRSPGRRTVRPSGPPSPPKLSFFTSLVQKAVARVQVNSY